MARSTDSIGLDSSLKYEDLAYILAQEHFKSTQEWARIQRLKDRICSVESVLPIDLEQMRQATPVCTSFHAKSNPKVISASKPLLAKHTGTAEQLLFEQTVLPYTVAKLPAANLCINDKLMPHSIFDFMAISSEAGLKSFGDLSLFTQTELFRLFARFGRFCEQYSLSPTIAFTSDPDTKDRLTAQGVGRFHAHFIGRPALDISEVKNHAVALSSFSRLEQRRLVDEYTVVASLCIADRLRALSFASLQPIVPFEDSPRLPSLSFKILGGWDVLMSPATLHEFKTLIAVYKETFETIQKIVAFGDAGEWQRPQLRALRSTGVRHNLMGQIAALNWFSADVLRILERFLSRLPPRAVVDGRKRLSLPAYTDITSHIYPLVGAVYTAGFARQGDNLRLTFTPTLFSNTGGAGVCPIDGVVTRICRGQIGYLTDQEVADRLNFQKAAVEFICRNETEANL